MSDELEAAIAEAAKEAAEEGGIVGDALKEEAPADVKQETKVEETEAEEKVEETKSEAEPEAEEKPITEEETLGLSAEQLEAIQKDENLRAVYKSMQRGMTKKAQEVAEARKAIESDQSLVKFINEDPEKALEILAQRTGKRIIGQETETQQQKEETVDHLMELWTKKLGGSEQAKEFLEGIKETFETLYERQAAPLVQTTEHMRQEAESREVAAAIAEFGANVKERGGEWNDDVQKDMAAKMSRMQPGEGVPIGDYLKELHSSVMWDRAQSGKTKSALERLRRAETETEPVGNARPPEPQQISLDPSLKLDELIDNAVAIAQRESK